MPCTSTSKFRVMLAVRIYLLVQWEHNNAAYTCIGILANGQFFFVTHFQTLAKLKKLYELFLIQSFIFLAKHNILYDVYIQIHLGKLNNEKLSYVRKLKKKKYLYTSILNYKINFQCQKILSILGHPV